jgi:photosystem II stability/assembly factor-like uncharacterized protein
MGDVMGYEQAFASGGDSVIKADGGIFLSEDGGTTWTSIFDKKLCVYSVTLDKANPGRLFACTWNQAVCRSDDNGKNWNKLKGFSYHSSNHVIIDPINKDMVYVTTSGANLYHGQANGEK